MKYISLLLQNLLRIVLIYFLTLIWVRYFIKKLWFALFISAGITIVIDLSIRFLTRKKDKRLNMKVKEKEEAENMFLSLTTNPNYITFFFNLAKKENPNAIKKKNFCLLESPENKTLFYPFMSANELTKDDITKVIVLAEKEKATKIVISCGDINKDALLFAKSIDKKIILLDKFASYNDLYKYYNLFPEITLTYKKNKKLAFKELFAFSFNKSRTKGYLFSAIILFISTFFIRMNIYYCIMASLLIVFALISYFNPYFNVKTNKAVLG